MPSRGYRRARGTYGRRYSRRESGRERAERHIREARELSAELGGTDQDVKEYFFGLSPQELTPILDEYGRRNGASAREYAELTIPKWESGQVQMSGMVASRLFRLLPPRMPLEAKYRLTKSLWTHVGPSSDKRVRVGNDATLGDVLAVASRHMADVAVHYTVPEALERRFAWLTARDVHLRQQILNRLQDEERELVVEAIRQQFPILQGHSSGHGGQYTQRLTQTVRVAKHTMELVFDHSLAGVHLEDRTRASFAAEDRGSDLTWLWWAAGIGLLLLFILSVRGGG